MSNVRGNPIDACWPSLPLVDQADVAAWRGQWRDRFAARIGSQFSGRLAFEVGCFDAGFLNRIAANHPAVGFVGIDWKARSLAKGAAEAVAMGLKNVLLLRGRAQDLCTTFADGELDEVWVFHPEPCDEPRQLKNRLIAEPFLRKVYEVLRPGGSLSIKTDHPGYYQWVLALLGREEPAWFKDVRLGRPTADGRPKVRPRDLMPLQDLPQQSEAIARQFAVRVLSPDFWNDQKAIELVAGHTFTGETTAFESRFLQKRQPIYFVELVRTAPEVNVAG